MHVKQIVWSCAGGLLLVMASASYAADPPADVTASAPPPEATAAPADATAAAPADATVTPAAEASANPQTQVATETPADARAEQQMASADKAAKAAPAAMVVAPAVVSDPGSVYLIRENPFFGLHIDKAIGHARDAEIAGNMGQTTELMEHAKLSLMRAREAQRAGNVPGINEGIANLRKALSPQASAQASPSVVKDTNPQIKQQEAEIAASTMQDKQQRELAAEPGEANAVRDATNYVREARKNFSQAAGTKYVELKPQPVVAVSTEK